MKLINECEDVRVSTTGIEVKYSDDAEAILSLCAYAGFDAGSKLYKVNIRFALVAEVLCKTVNFYESNYKQFEIVSDSDSKSSDISGFYQVIDSSHLAKNKELYDPRNNLNLKHYLVVGGDGYCEILAASYSLSWLSEA